MKNYSVLHNKGTLMCDYIVDNIWSVIGTLIAIIGSYLAIKQWKESCLIKRNEYVYDISEKLRTDEQLLKVKYFFEYNIQWYDERFHDSYEEKDFDSYFLFINYICYLYNKKRIKREEFSVFEYIVNRVCRNPYALSYFWNIYHFSKKDGSCCSFQEIINYAYKLKFIDKDFYNSKTTRYGKKNLNF